MLQPSTEQDTIITIQRADLSGSLRVVAFAGSGKTTALHLLAEADTTSAFYVAYKSTQLTAQHCFRTMLCAVPCTAWPSVPCRCSSSHSTSSTSLPAAS